MSSNPCIRTGADVILPTEGEVVHGDLFLVGDVFILVCSNDVEKCTTFDVKNPRVNQLVYTFQRIGRRNLVWHKSDADVFVYDKQPIFKS